MTKKTKKPRIIPSNDPAEPIKMAEGKKLKKAGRSKIVKKVRVSKKKKKDVLVKIPVGVNAGKYTVFVKGTALRDNGITTGSVIKIESPREKFEARVIFATPPVFLDNIMDGFVTAHIVYTHNTRESLCDYLGISDDSDIIQMAQVVKLT